MKVLKTIVMGAALAAVVTAGPVFAQQVPPTQPPPTQPPTQPPPTQPPATPPATQQPPTTPPPAAPQTPAPQAQPPRPFPVGAKIALINLQAVASNSNEGKAASAKIQAFVTKKSAEITEKGKAVQALQTKLQQGGTVLSEQARSQAEKDLQKLQRELQNMQEDAGVEQKELQDELQLAFQNLIAPIIEQVAMEKELHAIVGVETVVWGNAAVDITAEVIKRVDAAPKTPVKK
jgi:Skp family chaperone for outer membrane proteins